MCITVGVAQRNLRSKCPTEQSPVWGEIINQNKHHLALAGLWKSGRVPNPAVALHTPSRVKNEKQIFH
ncbi:MAG: hypothetical protein LBE12_00310 [Planctomycetaceae bacterium]|nr:hypothetical protein [Planctomycetaceae bacterium]